jgi:hypothetical protein
MTRIAKESIDAESQPSTATVHDVPHYPGKRGRNAGRHATVVVPFDASYHDALAARERHALRHAAAVVNDATANDRDAARDGSLGSRHWRFDGAARQAPSMRASGPVTPDGMTPRVEGRWYETGTLSPLPRHALQAPCASVKGSARPMMGYETETGDPRDACMSAPTADAPDASMTPRDVTRRLSDDAECREDADTLVNAARCATGRDIDALCKGFLAIRLTWSVKYEIAALGRIFDALPRAHRVKLHRALRDAKR